MRIPAKLEITLTSEWCILDFTYGSDTVNIKRQTIEECFDVLYNKYGALWVESDFYGTVRKTDAEGNTSTLEITSDDPESDSENQPPKATDNLRDNWNLCNAND